MDRFLTGIVIYFPNHLHPDCVESETEMKRRTKLETAWLASPRGCLNH
jgi:hypothetical protein